MGEREDRAAEARAEDVCTWLDLASDDAVRTLLAVMEHNHDARAMASNASNPAVADELQAWEDNLLAWVRSEAARRELG